MARCSQRARGRRQAATQVLLIDHLLYFMNIFITLIERGLGELKFIYFTSDVKMVLLGDF